MTAENHDRVPLYITEMGWGSQNDFKRGRLRAGRRRARSSSCAAPTATCSKTAHRLDLKQVYWFSWKDLQGACNFCDSVGLFHEGPAFRPKPSWQAFVAITPRPALRP